MEDINRLNEGYRGFRQSLELQLGVSPLLYKIGGTGIRSLFQVLSLSASMVVPFCEERPKGDNRSPYNPTKTACTSYTAPFQRILHKTGAKRQVICGLLGLLLFTQ